MDKVQKPSNSIEKVILTPYSAGFFLVLLFAPEDGDDKFLRNIGTLNYEAS
jgi:hypothetical protein